MLIFKIVIGFCFIVILGIVLYFFAYKNYHFTFGKNLLQFSESLSEEDRFYGAHRINSFVWKRIDYHYNPEVKKELAYYYDDAVLEAFSGFSAVVYEFAEKKNISIQKYYKDLPMWFLYFYHPSGGLGRITITLHSKVNANDKISSNEDREILNSSSVISIYSIWTAPEREPINDIETNMTITDPAENLDILIQSLEMHYKNILSWVE